ncbi:hypothetical protein GCM10010492_25710 [Saccharothrix mutabilis subsp. mutabilis]|uniref:Uncharacterized protein n=1 Tax=Saccharothrix mutabilis subsp. mutabilis TaxID=66855 RepID=A0ABN0TNR7_9PSEU
MRLADHPDELVQPHLDGSIVEQLNKIRRMRPGEPDRLTPIHHDHGPHNSPKPNRMLDRVEPLQDNLLTHEPGW